MGPNVPISMSIARLFIILLQSGIRRPVCNMALYDQDVHLDGSRELNEKSRRKLRRLIEDLNLEIVSMPTALRNPFRIVREIAIEMSGE